MRATIVTNMYPTAARPYFGVFVQDQVEALRRTGAVELDVVVLPAGDLRGFVRVTRELRARPGSVDVVHAHFGLSAWPALAARAGAHLVTLHGTDLAHPRSRKITKSALPFLDLVATASSALARGLPRWLPDRRRAVLPTGVDVERFRRIEREQARDALGLDRGRRYLLFPTDPARPEKRYDLARRLADSVAVELLTMSGIPPEQVPLHVNAADAVLITSDREGFGLGIVEALACDVPVLSTPVGIAPEVLPPVAGTLCADFSLARWHEHLTGLLRDPDPRVAGRMEAERLSSDLMAARVLECWRELVRRARR